jgi:mannan endo-1,4-beta-mannosidase
MPLGPDLVRIRGGQFDLAGSRFAVTGANNYYAGYATGRMRANALAAAGSFGFNVLRSWAFLDCAVTTPTVPEKTWRGTYFQAGEAGSSAPRVNEQGDGLMCLDHLIADAHEAGIRLILPLVNYWTDFGGMDQYVQWFGGGPRDRFYRDAAVRAAYQSYVQRVLTRRNTITNRLYCDEPAILAWELANEPECDTADGCAVLLEWLRTMSAWVRRCDPNHLIAAGDQGYFRGGSGDLYNGSHGVDCAAFLRLPDIDFGTFHLYPQGWNQTDPIRFGIEWIDRHLQAGRDAGKPVVMEEYGMSVGPGGLPSALARDFVYRCWLREIIARGGAGDLGWMIAGDDDSTGAPYPDYDHFTFYTPADIPSIRDHVLQMIDGAQLEEPLNIRMPGAGEGIVHVWVTDESGFFLNERDTGVIIERDGTALGVPLTLDFSGGCAQLAIPAAPLSNLIVYAEPLNYNACNSGMFRLDEGARLFLHLKTRAKN